MNKPILLVMASCVNVLYAQDKVTLFPDQVPGETVQLVEKDNWNGCQVGGKPVLRKTDVSTPEITLYLTPKNDSKKHPAVIVCPGGGYGMRNTGHQVNEWPERAADWFRELHLIP